MVQKGVGKQLDISIVIVNYNAKDFLEKCLRAVFQEMKGVDFEVWLVDNASKDDSLEMVRREFPEVRIIANKENVGFAKANNQAIEKAKGRYIFLLNPDTILLDENLKELVGFLEEHPEAGACGPLVLNNDGSMQRQCKRGDPTFWTSFTYYSGLWRLFPESQWWRKTFGRYFVLDKPDDEACEVDQLSGAAMIVKKEAIDKIGPMSEDYVMYWEDVDWCFRIRAGGWKIYYVPLARITHYGGASGSQLRVFKNLWYFHWGACLFYRRYLAHRYFFAINFLYYGGVWFAFALKILSNLFRKEKIIGSKKPS
jgi:GT2 family glycosyltransferase